MPLSSTFEFSIQSNLTKTADFGSPSSAFNYSKALSLATGTAAGQADVIFSDQYTSTISETKAWDLSGTLTDAFGITCSFVKVKSVAFYSAATNTVSIALRSHATTGPTGLFLAGGDGVLVYPGGWFFWFAGAGNNGAAVVNATGDVLEAVNGAASSIYDIFIAGTSA